MKSMSEMVWLAWIEPVIDPELKFPFQLSMCCCFLWFAGEWGVGEVDGAR